MRLPAGRKVGFNLSRKIVFRNHSQPYYLISRDKNKVIRLGFTITNNFY
jgi:hypothetical protein